MSALTNSSDTSAVDNPHSRRKFPRMELHYELFTRIGDKELCLSTANLSYGGAFFDTRQDVLLGTILEFDLRRGEESVSAKARVVHRNNEGFAVAFLNPGYEFTSALCSIITKQIMNDSNFGATGYEVPGRIAVLVHEGQDFKVLFTSNLGPNGVWVLSEELWAFSETMWITLLEHGMYDCETRVLWCTENALALEFLDPSVEFQDAYQRVLDSFLI